MADIEDLTSLPGLVSVLGLGGLVNCELIAENIYMTLTMLHSKIVCA